MKLYGKYQLCQLLANEHLKTFGLTVYFIIIEKLGHLYGKYQKYLRE